MDAAFPSTRLTSFADSHPLATAISAVISLGVIYFVVLLPLYNIYLHPLRKYPGPKLWAASQIPWFRSYLGGLYHITNRDLHEKYGPVVRVGPNELSFNGPDAWQSIMGHRKSGEAENGKAAFYAVPPLITGLNRTNHSRVRRLMSHGFSSAALREQESMIQGYIDLLIQRLHENSNQGALDICAWFNYATFDIIGDLTFGEPFGCLQQSAMHPWVQLIFANVKTSAIESALARFPVAKQLLPFFVSPKLVKQASESKELSKEKVSRRLELQDARLDLVHGMTAGKGGLTLTREELDRNSEGLIIAGSETTATALSGAMYMLTTHPEIMKTLSDEVRSAFASESEINSLNTARLPYLQAVLEETLRFFPPAPNSLPRITPPEGNIVLGDKIPGNTVLSIPHWAMYHSRSNFSRPDEFIPNRWLDDPTFANDRKECMNVFSFGPRNCIGKNLAYVEMRMFLARVVWNFDIELAAAKGVDGLDLVKLVDNSVQNHIDRFQASETMPPWLAQAVILNQISTSFTNEALTVERSKISRGILDNVLRKFETPLQVAALDFLAAEEANDVGDEMLWKAWVDWEVLRRLAYGLWLIDSQICLLFNYTPAVPTESPALQTPLPSHERMWERPCAESWKQEWDRTKKFESPTLREEMQSLYRLNPAGQEIGGFSFLLILFGFFRDQLFLKQANDLGLSGVINVDGKMISHMGHRPNPDLWRLLDPCRRTGAKRIKLATIQYYHVISIINRVPLRDLYAFAGWRVARSKQLDTIRRLLSWTTEHGDGAREIALHAAKLFHECKSHSSCGYQEPVAMLISSLALWMYNTSLSPYALERREGFQNQSVVTIRLDEDIDREEASEWVRTGKQARPFVPGVGDIHMPGGYSKVVTQAIDVLESVKEWKIGQLFSRALRERIIAFDTDNLQKN
ncbi:hypothetical protein CkaCkLH20_09392 [Colletotrichum karsti]|uniref:Cytochrome P450 n=1 Tax=Colletotrichum karsti TaxID=1095194 RepID=A0A9P6HZ23_9PEZI|nr:uncharacterized protein CkaCkLH20_09392 [Colletotrichum karsti]KAF9873229.1 hypothetical protein CkaCkLH20_09392 [Colletotrichum karsti]